MSVESAKHVGGLAYDIKLPEFLIRVDVKEKQGGANSAPDPHDYLEAALAGCTAITVQMYANRKGIPLESVDVKISITKEGKEGNEITREVKFKGNLTEEQKTMLLAIAEKCPIHHFLVRGANIRTTQMVES
ncbi:MAG: OsmC family protein [Bdellovibrionota bacterium]